MKFEKLAIPEVILIKPNIYKDDRGCFFESYNKKDFFENGIKEEFVQDNQSVSKKGVIRGLHFQLNPKAQGKLVRVTNGSVIDVAVDIRKNSPTFGMWVQAWLSNDNGNMLYIPPGFAHGFQALNEDVVFCYKCTEFYSKENERSIRWDDKDLNISWYWNSGGIIVSEKDKMAPFLKEVIKDINFEY